ncbi:MAG TPA: tetratricopeptide repeat protein, partial [Vicinamibacteria bacterium]|nr:tetratricopeptide repeat protein [Vicinamibacteria bacterium]
EDTEIEERMGRLRGEMDLLPPLPTPVADNASTEVPFVEASEQTLFVAPEAEEASVADSPTPGDELSPIPLAEVEGPMELEDRFYQPPPKPSPPEEAPLISPPSLEAPATPEPPAPPPAPFAREVRSPTPPPAPPPQRTEASAAPPKSPIAGPSSPETIAKSKADMETRTLAELYASQGHVEKAIEVYKNLLARNPGDVEYQTRVDELTMLQQASARRAKSPSVGETSGESGVGRDAPADEVRGKTIALLEQWLHAIRESKRA